MFKLGYKRNGKWAYKQFENEEDLMAEVWDLILYCEKVTIKCIDHIELNDRSYPV